MNRIGSTWNLVGTNRNLLARVARFCIYSMLAFLAFESVTAHFDWPEQAVLGALTIVITLAFHKTSESELVTLSLMFASMLATARYGYWRVTTVGAALFLPNHHIPLADVFFMLLLLVAEIYAFVILFLGFIQTARPLKRPPASMPDDLEAWPHIDILIPTYNEPLSIVRSTTFAAINIDYPPEKLHVYICDDGRRQEFRAFCEEVGVGYLVRKDNKHAKAGNINAALKLLTSPYVAIFDCDHIPTRSFLQMTLGWFFRDPKLGLMQTPHFFYSPDPFERNLSHFKVIPNEGELFYGVLQDGNDLWNATFFCGSCAVLRRTALDEVGGIAVETVTEDAHTSLRMQTRGWNTAYINLPQAAGLATESLSSHVGQRIRWARGMVQILRTDSPLTVRGLTWTQRVCYLNAMLHFLYAVPRLVFLTAPLVYMLLGCINIPGYWAAILAYSFPHLFLANVVNMRIQGKHRYSFWNEVYETVLAPYILLPTLLALINPKLGKFNVTAKGGIVDAGYFDRRIARPYVFLILLNFAGLAIAPVRFFYWNAHHPGTIAMNVVWILFNLIIIGTANAVAIESPQRRYDVRVDLRMPAEIRLSDGQTLFGETVDLSMSGTYMQLEEATQLPHGTSAIALYSLRGEALELPVVVVSCKGRSLRFRYEQLNIEQEERLNQVLYSRADMWVTRGLNRPADRPLHSFLRLMTLSVRGVGMAFAAFLPKRASKNNGAPAAAKASAVILLLLLSLGSARAWAAPGRQGTAQAGGSTTQPAEQPGNSSFQKTVSLAELGYQDAFEFRGVQAAQDVHFYLSNGRVITGAKLNLHYSFSSGLIPQMSHLNVLLNGVSVATLPVPAKTDAPMTALATTLDLPAELLTRSNQLTFQFIGHYTQTCEDPANTTLWARVDPNTSISLSGSSLEIANDLKSLPLPFFDADANPIAATIPIAFARQPSHEALEAAGVISSWFGVKAQSRTLSFPTSVGGALPAGNVILLVQGEHASLPAELRVPGNGARIALTTNPSDHYGKVLIIMGDDGDQLLTAARSIALGANLLQGSSTHIADFQMPPARHADDAPLWMTTDGRNRLWNYSQDNLLQTDGSGPLRVYLRLPPDLYFGDRATLPLHLDYRYNAISVANDSTLRVTMNGALVNELPLPHSEHPEQQLSTAQSVPVETMRPFSNSLLFNYYFRLAKKGPCEDTPPIDLQGSIVRSSWLDIAGLPHWAAMPNLELFSNAGFPFTRFADLAQTTIVLPEVPSAQEIELYLDLLAYFGEQTGYPALRVNVGGPGATGQDSDYLVLGTAADQAAFSQLNRKLPVEINTDGLVVRGTSGFFARLHQAWWQVAQLRPNWWWRVAHPADRNGVIAAIGEAPDALIEEIESPWSPDRTVVTLSLRGDETADAFTKALYANGSSSAISQSVSVLHGRDFTSFRLSDGFYRVGSLPWYGRVRYYVLEYPWLIVVFTFVLGMFVVPWIRARLDRRVKERLQVGR